MYPIIHLFGLELSTNYLLMYIGLLMFFFYFKWLSKGYGITHNQSIDILLLLIFSALIGARIWHVLLDRPGFFFHNPLQIVMIHKGGFSSLGACFAFFFSLMAYGRKIKVPYRLLLDLVASGGFIAMFMTRLGCLFAGCCYGYHSDSWFHIVFHQYGDMPKTGIPLGVPLYPSQLMFAANHILWAVFAFFILKRRRFHGEGFLLSVMGFICVRFWLEFFRHKTRNETIMVVSDYPLNMYQVWGPVIVLTLLVIYILHYRRYKTGNPYGGPIQK
jgi:phosphatidylglycerol:prolipoprotein diacylglycerol transferase